MIAVCYDLSISYLHLFAFDHIDHSYIYIYYIKGLGLKPPPDLSGSAFLAIARAAGLSLQAFSLPWSRTRKTPGWCNFGVSSRFTDWLHNRFLFRPAPLFIIFPAFSQDGSSTLCHKLNIFIQFGYNTIFLVGHP